MVRLKALADREEALTSEVDAMREALDKMSLALEGLQVHGIGEVPYEVQRLILFGIMHLGLRVESQRIEDWFWHSTFARGAPESSRLLHVEANSRVANRGRQSRL